MPEGPAGQGDPRRVLSPVPGSPRSGGRLGRLPDPPSPMPSAATGILHSLSKRKKERRGDLPRACRQAAGTGRPIGMDRR